MAQFQTRARGKLLFSSVIDFFYSVVWIDTQCDENYIFKIEPLVWENTACFSVFIHSLPYWGLFSRGFEKSRCGSVFEHGNIWIFLCI